jgi:periplasmic divalent cation tolerance protein
MHLSRGGLMNEIIILSTAGSLDQARRIASALVEGAEAACVNIVPGMRSIYRWEGKVCDEDEVLLLIKTTEDLFEAARSRIRQLHSYQIPEIIALPIPFGDGDYLLWLRQQLKAPQ